MNIYDDEIKDLINSYSRLLFKITYDFIKNKEETENIVQDSFLSYYNRIDHYNDLAKEEKRRILARIAINKCKDYLKSKKNIMKDNLDDEMVANIKSGFSVEEFLIKQERKMQIEKAVNELKEPYKTLVNYYYLKDYTLDMVCDLTKTKKETVKVQLTRAKDKLRDILIEGGELNE